MLCPSTDNIKLGAAGTKCSQAKVEAAARQANAHDFVVGLEDKYDTMVGQAGKSLSGGQKQRIASTSGFVVCLGRM